MEQLPEELLYQIFEYLPLDVKIQVGGDFLRRYEAANICMTIMDDGYGRFDTYKIREYRLDGQLHRSDGPAYIEYDEDDVIYHEQWFRNGKCHRDGHPANQYRHALTWYQNGQICNPAGPYRIDFYPDGRIKSERLDDYDTSGKWLRDRMIEYPEEN